jgi:sorbose reductase
MSEISKPALSKGLSLFSLHGRTAIVSGVASTGIGFSISQILAEAGANVALLYNRNESALDGAKEIELSYAVKCEGCNSDTLPLTRLN